MLGYTLSPSWKLVGSCGGKVWLRNVRPFFDRLVSSGHPRMEVVSLQILQFHRRTHKACLCHSLEQTKGLDGSIGGFVDSAPKMRPPDTVSLAE